MIAKSCTFNGKVVSKVRTCYSYLIFLDILLPINKKT